MLLDIPPVYARDVTGLQAAAPSMVFVHVTWCGYCKQAKPILEKVSEALGAALPVYAVDADQNPGLAESLGVKSFPTIFFVDANEVKKFEGQERTFDSLVGFACESMTADTSRAIGVCLASTKKSKKS